MLTCEISTKRNENRVQVNNVLVFRKKYTKKKKKNIDRGKPVQFTRKFRCATVEYRTERNSHGPFFPRVQSHWLTGARLGVSLLPITFRLYSYYIYIYTYTHQYIYIYVHIPLRSQRLQIEKRVCLILNILFANVIGIYFVHKLNNILCRRWKYNIIFTEQ